MQIPNFPSGHLYQYMAVLGAFLTVASAYSMGTVYQSGDERLRGSIGHLLTSDEKTDARKFWESYLVSNKALTTSTITSLSGSLIFGILLCTAGMTFWYWKHQRHEDERNVLTLRKEIAELDKSRGIKPILLKDECAA